MENWPVYNQLYGDRAIALKRQLLLWPESIWNILYKQSRVKNRNSVEMQM